MHAKIIKQIAQQLASDSVVRQDISKDVGVEDPIEDNNTNINASPKESRDKEASASAESRGPKKIKLDPAHVPYLTYII